MLINQRAQREFKRTGQDLRVKIDRQHLEGGVTAFEARHQRHPGGEMLDYTNNDIGIIVNPSIVGVFLQRQRPQVEGRRAKRGYRKAGDEVECFGASLPTRG